MVTSNEWVQNASTNPKYSDKDYLVVVTELSKKAATVDLWKTKYDNLQKDFNRQKEELEKVRTELVNVKEKWSGAESEIDYWKEQAQKKK